MRRLWQLFTQAVTVLLAFWLVVVALQPGWLRGERLSLPALVAPASPVTAPLLGSDARESPPAPSGSFREAAQRAQAAVVSIDTARSAKGRQDAWSRLFGGSRGHRRDGEGDGDGAGREAMGLGSGVLLSADGYILTNNHVIEGAEQIQVTLHDGRNVRARLVGRDPESDLAVLKVELDRLPVIALGSSDDLRVGDPVLAIGNPFGVGTSVTGGIVSALGRNQLGINTFENFIQTDAAINPGNSGGALVDGAGRLVGINTAIYSRSGGSMGIGFAIPVATARQVLEQLVREGAVTRGWIGVAVAELSPDVAQTLGTSARKGVAITQVLQGGPAARAGIRGGDVITAIAAQDIASPNELLSSVAALKPGVSVKVQLQRGRERLAVDLTPAKRPAPQPAGEGR